MTKPVLAPAVTIALTMTAFSACGGSASSSTTPSPSVTLNGTYAGTATDSSGPGRMTWQVMQNGNQLSGSASIVDTVSNATANGTVSGTVAGSTLTFRIDVPVGGIAAPWSGCSANANGTADATAASITGTYSGSNSCTGQLTDGHISLVKQ